MGATGAVVRPRWQYRYPDPVGADLLFRSARSAQTINTGRPKKKVFITAVLCHWHGATGAMVRPRWQYRYPDPVGADLLFRSARSAQNIGTGRPKKKVFITAVLCHWHGATGKKGRPLRDIRKPSPWGRPVRWFAPDGNTVTRTL
jgi:hypothetical protein